MIGTFKYFQYTTEKQNMSEHFTKRFKTLFAETRNVKQSVDNETSNVSKRS